VVIARAGHPPPVIVRSTGDIELIEPRGVLLGVADQPDFDEVQLELHLADTLLLYTDGVTEHRVAAAAQFDEHQLGLLVRNRRDTARAESIAQLVLDTVLLLAPAEQRDDIALLVASVTA
jgi:serine phosphatase RsbU (regulator of sigma subunit)